MMTEEIPCECGDDDCESCHDFVKRHFEDLQNQQESQYQKMLWGPAGIFFDEKNPLCKGNSDEER